MPATPTAQSAHHASDVASRAARRTLMALLLGPLLGAALPELGARTSHRFWSAMVDDEVLDAQRADGLIGLARPGDVDVVIVGSSIAHSGVDERLLEERLRPRRIRALHLAVAAASPASVAMMQTRLLALRPRAIVYLVSRAELSRHDLEARTRFYDPRAAARIFRPDELARDHELHVRGVIEWASVLRRRGPSFVAASLVPDRPPQLTVSMRDAMPAPPARMRRSIEEAAASIDRGPVNDEALFARALAEMAESAAKAGIPLLFAQSPLHEDLRRPDWIHGNFSGALEDVLDRLAQRRGVLRVRAEQLGPFQREQFRDGTHVGPIGRGRITVAIAAALAPALRDDDGLQ